LNSSVIASTLSSFLFLYSLTILSNSSFLSATELCLNSKYTLSAASTALLTSSLLPLAIVPATSSVAGLITSSVSPLALSTHSPSIYCLVNYLINYSLLNLCSCFYSILDFYIQNISAHSKSLQTLLLQRFKPEIYAQL